MIQTEAKPFVIFRNCVSSELRVRCCQYSRAFFCFKRYLFWHFARRALVRSRTPMILCLSNARSGDLNSDISFVVLHALVCEITVVNSQKGSNTRVCVSTYFDTADSKSGNRLALSDTVSYRRHYLVGFFSHF